MHKMNRLTSDDLETLPRLSGVRVVLAGVSSSYVAPHDGVAAL